MCAHVCVPVCACLHMLILEGASPLPAHGHAPRQKPLGLAAVEKNRVDTPNNHTAHDRGCVVLAYWEKRERGVVFSGCVVRPDCRHSANGVQSNTKPKQNFTAG